MPYPLAAARGRDAAQGSAGATQQPYLLNLTTYTDPLARATIGREFRVTAAASCYGLRFKSNGAQTINIHLWRTDTGAQVAVTNSLSAANGVNELLFSAPVTLDPALTYRISVSLSSPGAVAHYLRTLGGDHPDGPITILTANSRCYAATNNTYPATADTNSFGGEPIIYT